MKKYNTRHNNNFRNLHMYNIVIIQFSMNKYYMSFFFF